MDITVEIKAPELVEALQTLAAALAGRVKATAYTQQAPVQEPAPQPQQAPAVPVQQPAVPVQQPAVPTQQTKPAAAPQMPPAVPTATQTYTQEQLAVAAMQLVDTGRRDELVALLASFGVQALTQLPKEQYGAFATALRQLGAKI